MRTLLNLFMELLWLAGAAVFTWFFPKTFLGFEVFSALATLALWRVERAWQ